MRGAYLENHILKAPLLYKSKLFKLNWREESYVTVHVTPKSWKLNFSKLLDILSLKYKML